MIEKSDYSLDLSGFLGFSAGVLSLILPILVVFLL